MKLRVLIGYAGLKFFNFLPMNRCGIQLGQQAIRQFFGKLYLDYCGEHVNIQKHCSFSHRCRLGDNSGIGAGAEFHGPVYIGKNVMMGTDCLIYTQNHSFSDLTKPMIEQGMQEEKPVYIGDDVWIGGRVTILPGVHIGSGVVIGAGSVVTRDIPDNTVAGGNPARVLHKRGE